MLRKEKIMLNINDRIKPIDALEHEFFNHTFDESIDNASIDNKPFAIINV